MRVSRFGTATVAAVAVMLAACGSGRAATRATPATTALPSPTTRPAASGLPHVMVIVMENRDYDNVIGAADAPFLNELANQYVSATQSYAWVHGSLADYLELFSGSTHGIVDNCVYGAKGCKPSGASLVDQFDAHAVSWQAYMEGVSSSCYLGDDTGDYMVAHNPFVYFPQLRTQPSCGRVKPYEQLLGDLDGSTPAFVWVTPNRQHDMHDGTVAQGDAWVASQLPLIQRTAWYRAGGQVIITWDEGDKSNAGCCLAKVNGGHIPTIVVSERNRARGPDSAPIDTAGILASIEDVYGLNHLGDAANPANGSLGSALA